MKIILAVILCCFAVSVNAGCKASDFAGGWSIYFISPSSESASCFISIPKNKTKGTASCISSQRGSTAQQFSYSIDETSSCFFQSTLTDNVTNGAYLISGTISSRSKDAIAGIVMWDTSDGKNWSGTFSGTKTN